MIDNTILQNAFGPLLPLHLFDTVAPSLGGIQDILRAPWAVEALGKIATPYVQELEKPETQAQLIYVSAFNSLDMNAPVRVWNDFARDELSLDRKLGPPVATVAWGWMTNGFTATQKRREFWKDPDLLRREWRRAAIVYDSPNITPIGLGRKNVLSLDAPIKAGEKTELMNIITDTMADLRENTAARVDQGVLLMSLGFTGPEREFIDAYFPGRTDARGSGGGAPPGPPGCRHHEAQGQSQDSGGT